MGAEKEVYGVIDANFRMANLKGGILCLIAGKDPYKSQIRRKEGLILSS
jgi:hypothetical protein